MYRTNKKISVYGETLFRVKYEDGHIGGWFSADTTLPKDSVLTDEKTLVLSGCVLEGNINISSSQIGPNTTILTESKKTTNIKESKIEKTKLVLKYERANISNSEIQDSEFSVVFLAIKNSKIKNIFAKKNNSCERAIMLINDSTISTKTLVKYDNCGALNIKNTDILGKGRVLFNINENSNVCIEHSKFKDNEEKDINLNFYCSKTTISKTVFGTNCYLVAQKMCDIFDSEIIGDCETINGRITRSRIYGTFRSCADPLLTNCYIAKGACFDDTRANIKKTTIVDTDLFKNAKVLAEPGKNTPKKIKILGSLLSENATVVCRQGLYINNTTIKDDAKIQDCSLTGCKITDNAKLAMANMVDCIVLGDARIGFSCDDKVVRSAKIARFSNETFLNKYSVVFLDIRADKMAVAFVKTGIRIFHINNEGEFLNQKVNLSADIRKLEQFMPKTGKDITFLCMKNTCDCIDYFLKSAKISKDLLDSGYSTLAISSLMLYYYAVSLCYMVVEKKEKQILIENKKPGWYYLCSREILREGNELMHELDKFCFVDIKKQEIKLNATKIIIPSSLLGLYRKKPTGEKYSIIQAEKC